MTGDGKAEGDMGVEGEGGENALKERPGVCGMVMGEVIPKASSVVSRNNGLISFVLTRLCILR